jgi:putative acetyltransferase
VVLKIRGREPGDDAAIRHLNDLAFAGRYESQLIEDLRAANLAAIELIAVEQTAMVGHILLSRLDVSHGQKPVRALALAPMSVRPDRRRHGIGSTLVRAGLESARERGWEAVIVLGHRNYYPRFGFSAELARTLRAPFTGDTFMALELVPGALGGPDGRVVYPPAFGITT